VSAIRPNNRSYQEKCNDSKCSNEGGEKIYDMELNITGVTDYGVSMDAVMLNLEGKAWEIALNLRFATSTYI
jgi:hypothetical protein